VSFIIIFCTRIRRRYCVCVCVCVRHAGARRCWRVDTAVRAPAALVLPLTSTDRVPPPAARYCPASTSARFCTADILNCVAISSLVPLSAYQVTTSGKLFTHMCLCHQTIDQYMSSSKYLKKTSAKDIAHLLLFRNRVGKKIPRLRQLPR